jgi:hypothetical protein
VAYGSYWYDTTPTSTTFTIGNNTDVNASGGTYVAYLFAHDAGGFGLSGTNNVISCGSYTGNETTGTEITLGYEPQWIMVKCSSSAQALGWYMVDVTRGMNNSVNRGLKANSTNAETADSNYVTPSATGFTLSGNTAINTNGSTYIYVAIRRGPMKVPTVGTTVFGTNARTGTGANATVTGSAGVSDAVLIKNRGSAVGDLVASRLTGTGYMETSSQAAEVAAGTTILQSNPWDVMDGVKVGTTSTITNASANTYINYLFDRAPSFFDVVCWSGTGSYPFAIYHNLNVVPELIIFRFRNSGGSSWYTYAKPITSPNANWYQNKLNLDTNSASVSDLASMTSTPTRTLITVDSTFSEIGSNYISYLFATCPGVSKVGSYTGTGALQTVNCGFTSGARFVLIKRTDTTGSWYTYDSARGITSGNDPYFFLNSTAAEVTSTNYVDTDTTGFQVTAAAPAGLNASGGTYLFLAIA